MSDLVQVLSTMLRESEAASYEVGQQRETNHRYYSLQPLGNEIDGRSHYISPDVLDSVESKKALFAETFFSGRRVLKFSGEDKRAADQATAYVEQQLNYNRVHELFRDGWHDALVAKKMTIIADWKDDTEVVTVDLKNATQHDVMQIIEDQRQQNGPVIKVNHDDVQQGQGEQGPVSSGPLKLSFDTSCVHLILAPPENCFRDPAATYVHESQYFTLQEEVARGDLVQQGVSSEQVDALVGEYRFQSNEDSSRKAHDGSSSRRSSRADNQELVTVYTTWAHLDMSEYGEEHDGQGLYRVRWTTKEILTDEEGNDLIEEVSEMPIFEWTEYKISHADNGLADADLSAHTQKVQSTLKRLIIDNQQMRNTSRYEATVGAVKNPRELIDNNIGGTVWTRQPGSVTPLAAPELSPLTLSVIQMLDIDKESRSGQSKLAKGMEMGAVNNQNAADMVEKLTSAGQRRVMRAARDFAHTFFVPLCQYIYRLGVRNDSRMHRIEVEGEYAMLEPASWPDKQMSMDIAVALTPGECERHAKSLINLYQFQMADPDLKMGFGYAQKHALLDDIYDCLGVPDSSSYLLRPDSPEYQQKQQFQAQQMQQQQKEQQMQMQMRQAAEAKREQLQMSQMQFEMWVRKSEDGRRWAELEMKKAKTDIDSQNIIADNIRDDERLAWDMEKGRQEISIEQDQERAASIG